MQKQKHIPVLSEEVLSVLQPKNSDSYLDLTAGYGGHASQVLAAIGREGRAVLVDRDQAAVRYLQDRFEDDARVRIIHDDFLSASRELARSDRCFDMILADLGVSSPHLDNTQRGFSFQRDGPLDMRMDTRQPQTAADILNNASEAELTDILRRYGEVYGAQRISRLIIQNRPLNSTKELAELAAKASPGYQKVHPATKLFQALRIAVNQELQQLTDSLPLWAQLLKPGGRLAIISFHSLEDRIVKQFLRDNTQHSYEAILHLLTNRPLSAHRTEIVHNPRARSAKLRAAVKIKT